MGKSTSEYMDITCDDCDKFVGALEDGEELALLHDSEEDGGGWSRESVAYIELWYCPTCTKKRRENDAEND